MKILHIISSLDNGGAEVFLKRMILDFSNDKNTFVSVVSLSNKGRIGIELENLGIIVTTINFKTFLFPFSLFRLFIFILKLKPEIVQTWMYHSDFIGGILSKILGINKIFWNIRNSDIPQGRFSLTFLIRLINSRLSFFIPKKIFCNSFSGKVSHVNLGYCEDKIIVVPNCFEIKEDKFNNSKSSFMSTYGLSNNHVIIGAIGRFDKLKDYKNFVLASSLVSDEFSNVKFVLIGKDLDKKNSLLNKWIKDSNQINNFILFGFRNDVDFFLSEILDIFCLPSLSEGFPNVLMEAMAYGVPCVSTNVGDAEIILDGNGILVPPNNFHELALGLITMINTPLSVRQKMGLVTKQLIKNKYSVSNISNIYKNIYNEI